MWLLLWRLIGLLTLSASLKSLHWPTAPSPAWLPPPSPPRGCFPPSFLPPYFSLSSISPYSSFSTPCLPYLWWPILLSPNLSTLLLSTLPSPPFLFSFSPPLVHYLHLLRATLMLRVRAPLVSVEPWFVESHIGGDKTIELRFLTQQIRFWHRHWMTLDCHNDRELHVYELLWLCIWISVCVCVCLYACVCLCVHACVWRCIVRVSVFMVTVCRWTVSTVLRCLQYLLFSLNEQKTTPKYIC